MEVVHGDGGAFCPPHPPGRKVKKNRILVPRSSSPVAVYVQFPCVLEQALSTISWDGLGDCASLARRDSDSLGSRANESDQDFGDYALDFMADSPGTLENSLSSAELVPFQGCVIPPLTPQHDLSLEESLADSSDSCPQNDARWQGVAGRALGTENHQLHESLHRQQEELDALQERNLQLRLLATRAKHLASVLEKLMTVSELAKPCGGGGGDDVSLSPSKRQRLGEGCDSVEDMLRDVSARCDAVLHATGATPRQEAESVHVVGASSGLRAVISTGTEDSMSSFTTPVKEHCTIRTRVFPHGRAFTSRTQQGGYRFRWLPNHC